MSEPNELDRLLEIRETSGAGAGMPVEPAGKVTQAGPLFGWHGDAPRGRPRWRVFWWTLLAVTVACSIPNFLAAMFFWMFPVGLCFMLTPLLRLMPKVKGMDVESFVAFYAVILLWLVYYVVVRWFFSARRRTWVTIAYLVLCLLLALNVVGCQKCLLGLAKMGS